MFFFSDIPLILIKLNTDISNIPMIFLSIYLEFWYIWYTPNNPDNLMFFWFNSDIPAVRLFDFDAIFTHPFLHYLLALLTLFFALFTSIIYFILISLSLY